MTLLGFRSGGSWLQFRALSSVLFIVLAGYFARVEISGSCTLFLPPRFIMRS